MARAELGHRVKDPPQLATFSVFMVHLKLKQQFDCLFESYLQPSLALLQLTVHFPSEHT